MAHTDNPQELKDGKCVDRCPNDRSSWNGHKCVCDKGYESRWGKCVKPPTCPYGSYLKDWNCVCKDKAKVCCPMHSPVTQHADDDRNSSKEGVSSAAPTTTITTILGRRNVNATKGTSLSGASA